ncbi:putative F-box protein At4g10190 [Eutrema salsugineum]|uniref:putative F-box protein At4g10190 n=1 Tax=Eutrema salsugineum TaxID=72664 RepID=UPI000CED3151|nr:putative F-box protein At4g10190 [Eutrema salsugineum]
MRKRRRRSVMKRNKKRNTVLYIPEDLVVEIFSKVPEASLARFRSTSKRWNDLIKNDTRLAKKSVIMLIGYRVYLASVDIHATHNNVVKVTRQLTLKDPISDSSKEVDICNVFHCEGLLLCTTKDNRLVFWNPCSGETRWMIKPKSSYGKFDNYSLGKSSCDKCKILRVDQYGHGLEPCLVKYEIYDFTSNSWRSVGKTRDWSIPGLKRHGMSVNGKTYWLAYSYGGDPAEWIKEIILSFDFSTERFGIVSLPDVWMATKIESTGAMSWSKFLTVERAHRRQFFTVCNGMNFLVDQENKLLFCPGRHGNSNSFLHIVEDDKYIQLDHHDAGSQCTLLDSYMFQL